jgi:hypothetical protein
MSFFDSKQETINIELTSYGKLLLSKGKFKPVYYAFFDDDVVYDSSYINLSESQNDKSMNSDSSSIKSNKLSQEK